MSYLPARAPELVDAALMAAGRALYLANAFERKCQYVLRIFEITSHWEECPSASLAEAAATMSNKRLIGPVIEKLRSFPDVTPDQVVLLRKGRDARNFIAHEGADFGSVSHARERQLHEHLSKLRVVVADLATGDNLVSQWVYEIENREPAPYGIVSDYQSMVDSWVFEYADYLSDG